MLCPLAPQEIRASMPLRVCKPGARAADAPGA